MEEIGKTIAIGIAENAVDAIKSGAATIAITQSVNLASIFTENVPLSLSVSHTVAKRRQLCEYGLGNSVITHTSGTIRRTLQRRHTLSHMRFSK